MTTSIEIRRADYTGAGIYRTSTATTRSTITGIKLQVDSLQEAITKDVSKLPTASDTADSTTYNWLMDLGLGSDTFTLKGVISKDNTNSVDAVYIKEDLRYAVRNWFISGNVTLVWADEASSVSTSYTGLPLTATFQYKAGELDLFPFTLQFIYGEIGA